MNARQFAHGLVDFFSQFSASITIVLTIALSAIDISKIADWNIPCFGVESFPFGRIIYFTVLVSAIIFGIISQSNSKSISTLEKDNSDKSNKIIDLENTINDSVKDMSELLSSYLMLFASNLNFTHTERISVYKNFDSKFVLIGRYSKDPKLMKNGRNNYPLEEGFIGKGWSEGEFFISDLPDPLDVSVKSGKNKKKHEECMKQYVSTISNICPINEKEIHALKMKSRTYFVHRIDGFDGTPKAILVIESLLPNRFTKEDIHSKLQNIKEHFIVFVEKNNSVKHLTSNNLNL